VDEDLLLLMILRLMQAATRFVGVWVLEAIVGKVWLSKSILADLLSLHDPLLLGHRQN
jgi:hypothetical protein